MAGRCGSGGDVLDLEGKAGDCGALLLASCSAKISLGIFVSVLKNAAPPANNVIFFV